MYYTHFVFGILVSLMSLNFFSISNSLLFVLIILLFSVFPDIDLVESKIGKKNKPISKAINFIFGHRGLMHSIYIPLILFFIFYNTNNKVGIAILLGYFSHLFMDALTKEGIRPLRPIINKRINWFFKTNSISEKILFLAITFIDLYLILKYI